MKCPSYPPLQKLSDHNKGPLIVVAAYIFLISSILVVGIKIWTRLSTVRKLAWTDCVMLAATAFAILQTISITVSVNDGLGRHVDLLTTSSMHSAAKAFYASNIFMVATLASAKTSVTLLIISIKPLRWVILSCYVSLGVVGAWATAGIVALIFQCDIASPWAFGSPNKCIDQYALQVALGLVNILTDVAIVVLAFAMMRSVQVSSKKKYSVVASFGLRIFTPAFAICALVAYHDYYHSTPQDRTWHVVAPAIWSQIMMNISIITAAIPSIKKFFAEISSGLMGVTISEQYELTHSGVKPTQAQSGSGAWLQSSRSGTRSTRSHGLSSGRSQSGQKNLEGTAGDRFGNIAQVKSNSAVREEVREGESVKGNNVIHQTIDYEIEYEQRGIGRGEEGDLPLDRERTKM